MPCLASSYRDAARIINDLAGWLKRVLLSREGPFGKGGAAVGPRFCALKACPRGMNSRTARVSAPKRCGEDRVWQQPSRRSLLSYEVGGTSGAAVALAAVPWTTGHRSASGSAGVTHSGTSLPSDRAFSATKHIIDKNAAGSARCANDRRPPAPVRLTFGARAGSWIAPAAAATRQVAGPARTSLHMHPFPNNGRTGE